MKTSSIRFEASKFVLEQVLGKARFKIELPATAGGISIQQLVILAQQQQNIIMPITSVNQMLQNADLDPAHALKSGEENIEG